MGVLLILIIEPIACTYWKPCPVKKIKRLRFKVKGIKSNPCYLEAVATSVQIPRWPSPITSCATNMVSPLLLKLFMISLASLLPNLKFFVKNMEKIKQQVSSTAMQNTNNSEHFFRFS